MRKFANAKDQRNYWLVFDGPVDALWIENLNTVLDDNMTLCLASGERIKLRLNMHLLFEVENLSAASPATVSRCGMVYMTPNDLGWRPYQQAWVKRFIENGGEPRLKPQHLQMLEDWFDQFVDAIFEPLFVFNQE
jgi:dynein heavy chain, axonemal